MLAAIAELRGFEPEEIKAEQRAPAVKAALEPRGTVSTGEAGPDVRLLSVLFCDMVGSTGLSGRFNAEEMHDLISSYQDTVASAVTRFGGYVAKFRGDGVLAYFGWPSMSFERGDITSDRGSVRCAAKGKRWTSLRPRRMA